MPILHNFFLLYFHQFWFDCFVGTDLIVDWSFYFYYYPNYLTWFTIFPLFYGCLTVLPSVCSHCSLLWPLLRWSDLLISTPIFFWGEVHLSSWNGGYCFSLVVFLRHPNCTWAMSKDLQSSLVDREVLLQLQLLRWVWFGVRLPGFKPQRNT